jgi:uncharacterized protein (TIGR01370 family)
VRQKALWWGLLAICVPVVLWALVPADEELSAVALHPQVTSGSLNLPFDLATPTGLARLRALVALAPDRLDWRRLLASTLESMGQASESMAQWRLVAGDSRATDDDVRTAARELIGHRSPAEGISLLEALARRGRLDAFQIRDAAEQAGAAELWPASARLLELLAVATPADPYALETLARVEERRGDLEAAVAAWRRRFELPGATPSHRLAAVALLERLHRPADALALLASAGNESDLTEWRERASLAWELGHCEEEAIARKAILRRVPTDQTNRLALADELLNLGDAAAAERLYAEALAAAEDDPDVLAELAARRIDGPNVAAALPLLARLAALRDPPDRALEVLARAARVHDPAASAKWLDKLHGGGGGTAQTWLSRGELAVRLGDASGAQSAWQHVVELAPADVTDLAVRQARTEALVALAGLPGAGVAAAQRGRVLASIHSWAVYYGPPPASNVPIAGLQAPDLLVLEPDQPWHPRLLRRPGQHLLAYLSLGEVHKSRSYFEALARQPGVLASPNPLWPGAVSVDPRAPAWWGVVMEELVPKIIAEGYDGLFLDTLDDALANDGGDTRRGTQAAMAGLIQALRDHFPHTLLVGNGGLGMLGETSKLLDAVAVESVFTDYQFQPATYRLRAEAAAAGRAHDLAEKLKSTGLPMFVIEYVDPDNLANALNVTERVRGEGWVPFIATIGLDRLPTPPLSLTVGRNVPPTTP